VASLSFLTAWLFYPVLHRYLPLVLVFFFRALSAHRQDTFPAFYDVLPAAAAAAAPAAVSILRPSTVLVLLLLHASGPGAGGSFSKPAGRRRGRKGRF